MNSKLRNENIVWTVSEDYSVVPALNLFDEYDNEDLQFYRMMLLGQVYKDVNMEKLLEYLSITIPKTGLKNAFLKLVEIYLDDCFSENLLRNRPGAKEYRKKFYSEIEKKYSTCDFEKMTVEEEIEFVYSSRIIGKYVVIRDVTDEMIGFMRKRNNERDTDEIIKVLNACFLKYFYKNYRNSNSNDAEFELLKIEEVKSENELKEDVEKEKQRLNFKMKKKHIEKFNPKDLIGEVSIESAEFTKAIDEDKIVRDERADDGQAKSNRAECSKGEMEKMVESRYGEAIYPQFILENIEKDISTGIHEGIKLHITEGNFIKGKYDPYFAKAIESQREVNYEYYKDNELIFRRSINELKEIIRKKFISDEEDEDSFSNSGRLIPSRVWRNRFLNDDKIFVKNNCFEMESITVDILLDVSASQLEREEYVAAQAYIIAEALTSLNIPTRVAGFCNFFNYLVMTQYRDYNDPRGKNINIFKFRASGSNRDGLAFKYISNQMNLREEENKILIVLSDGKPNDKINLGVRSFSSVDAQDYEGDIAIKDTAQEIFNLKMLNRNVLGIFTGEEEDLEYEKKIYGKDFAYIKDLNRFSRTIGYFLQQINF